MYKFASWKVRALWLLSKKHNWGPALLAHCVAPSQGSYACIHISNFQLIVEIVEMFLSWCPSQWLENDYLGPPASCIHHPFIQISDLCFFDVVQDFSFPHPLQILPIRLVSDGNNGLTLGAPLEVFSLVWWIRIYTSFVWQGLGYKWFCKHALPSQTHFAGQKKYFANLDFPCSRQSPGIIYQKCFFKHYSKISGGAWAAMHYVTPKNVLWFFVEDSFTWMNPTSDNSFGGLYLGICTLHGFTKELMQHLAV